MSEKGVRIQGYVDAKTGNDCGNKKISYLFFLMGIHNFLYMLLSNKFIQVINVSNDGLLTSFSSCHLYGPIHREERG